MCNFYFALSFTTNFSDREKKIEVVGFVKEIWDLKKEKKSESKEIELGVLNSFSTKEFSDGEDQSFPPFEI